MKIKTFYQWFVNPIGEAIAEMKNVDEYCNYALRESDWTQLPDVPLSVSKKEEWAITRQFWRDIPNLYTNPNDIVWPIIPTE